MSRENVELVRRAYVAFNRGGLDGRVADFAHQYLERAIRMARFLGG